DLGADLEDVGPGAGGGEWTGGVGDFAFSYGKEAFFTASLQAEKELELNKSQTLPSKLSGIRYIEQRCLKLEHRVALQQYIISSIKSQL
ncbi:hypothetical protein SSX86_032613, partial [Deinandra increscens subsp. villosa]